MRTIHNWTEKEHDILRKHYNKDMTAEDIHYKYLPYLSVPVIQARASILGLTKSPRWTDEEVAILKMWSGVISAEEISEKYLPNRSVSAVRGKANNMKLTPYKRVYTKKVKNVMGKRNYCKWSEEELNIVIEHYMEMPASKLRIEYLPNRSSSDIYNAANRLGLKKKNIGECKRWTDDEIKILKEYVGIISVTDIQNKYLPNRSISSIYKKIYQLGY